MSLVKNNTCDTKLIFPEFVDIKVSTKTFTANTNIYIDIDKLFHILPITEYEIIPKKRGRKKKIDVVDPNSNLKHGSIITLKYENNVRGVELKVKKTNRVRPKWFRNSVTVVIIFDKHINFKVCKNGTFHMTGCKNSNHAELCVKYIWEFIKDTEGLYTFTRGTCFEAMFVPSMRNIDFSLGFNVDREKLNNYMCTQNEFHCLLETSFGYTGVNIKVPLAHDIRNMRVRKLVYDGKWISKTSVYNEYVQTLSEKDKKIKLSTERYNTFLVFHSGKVIMSGLTSYYMKDVYYYFLDVIQRSYDDIKEVLDT